MTFDEAIAFALTLPDTERGTSYGKPAVKVASNGRAFLFPSHEADTSFGVAIDLDTIELLKETDPETFWQSPHYIGWEGVLIRYDGKDEDRVREVIARSRDCPFMRAIVVSRKRTPERKTTPHPLPRNRLPPPDTSAGCQLALTHCGYWTSSSHSTCRGRQVE